MNQGHGFSAPARGTQALHKPSYNLQEWQGGGEVRPLIRSIVNSILGGWGNHRHNLDGCDSGQNTTHVDGVRTEAVNTMSVSTEFLQE